MPTLTPSLFFPFFLSASSSFLPLAVVEVGSGSPGSPGVLLSSTDNTSASCCALSTDPEGLLSVPTSPALPGHLSFAAYSSTPHIAVTTRVWNTDALTDVKILSTSTIIDVKSWACVDSATQVGITQTDKHVVSFDGKHYTLHSILSKPGAAKGCTVGFPTVTDGGEPILISTADSLLAEDASENLLSLAQLLLNCYSVDLQIGSATNKTFGSAITTPEGQKITMVFWDNLWLLPLWVPAPGRAAAARLVQGIEPHTGALHL
eukprot:905314-Rhodomonas_salina.2